MDDTPYKRIETSGENAFEEWRRLRREGVVAIVAGDDDDFERLIEPLEEEWGADDSVSEILEAAALLVHPDDLLAEREAAGMTPEVLLAEDEIDLAAAGWREIKRDEAPAGEERHEGMTGLLQGIGALEPSAYVAPEPSEMSGLSLVFDVRTGKPIERVNLAVIPIDDWTTLPAYLNWGGWNECPAPEFHVAALRSWRDRYGAELVGLGPDVMNIRVARRPETPEEALSLAREHFAYCTDIVMQGSGSIEDLAETLLNEDWWFFWWD